jgi:hypothetical protein
LIGLLSLKIGQVTGWLGRGSGIPPLVSPEEDEPEPELEPHAASSEPAPPRSTAEAAPPRKKSRRDVPGPDGPKMAGRLPLFQPSRGCTLTHLSSARRNLD